MTLLPRPFGITLLARPHPSDSSRVSRFLGTLSVLAVRGTRSGRSSLRAPEAGSSASVTSLQEGRSVLVCSGRLGSAFTTESWPSRLPTGSSGFGLAAMLTTIACLANNRMELTALRAAAHTARSANEHMRVLGLAHKVRDQAAPGGRCLTQSSSPSRSKLTSRP